MKACVWFWCLGLGVVFCFGLSGCAVESAWTSPLIKEATHIYTSPAGVSVPIQEIQQMPESQWRRSDLNNSFGFVPDQEAWLRISLVTLGTHQNQLVVHRANLKEVCLFSRALASCFSVRHSWAADALVLAAEPVFSLDRLVPEAPFVYLRVRSPNYITVPFSIVSEAALKSRFLLKQLLDFSAMGTFFSLIFLNLVLAFWLKKSVYFLHASALLCWSIAWFGILMGYSAFLPVGFHHLLLGQAPIFALPTVFFSLLAYLLFARHELSPRLRRWLWGLPGLLALTFVVWLLPFPLLHLVLIRLWALGMIIVVVLGLCCSLSLKKYWSAFYLFCWLAFYGTIFALNLFHFSLLPLTLLSYSYLSWLQCLSMLTLVLIPLLSGESLKRVADVLMMRNLMFALDQRQLLEKQVEERTLALQDSIMRLEETNEKLTVLNRSKARLFVILAHDLRTPFLSMLTLLKVFERGVMKQAGFLEMLPRLKSHLENVSASLDNMLTWIKAELDGYAHERRSLSVKRLIDEVYGVYEEPARQKQVQLIVRDVSTDLRIRADRNHMRLVLRNIVGNALKFTPEAGTIEIWAEWENDTHIRVSVQDNGLGFSAADLERFHAREALTSRAGTSGEKGLGLGLQACLAYLEVNRGVLTLECLSPGSSVQFTLPCASVIDAVTQS